MIISVNIPSFKLIPNIPPLILFLIIDILPSFILISSAHYNSIPPLTIVFSILNSICYPLKFPTLSNPSIIQDDILKYSLKLTRFIFDMLFN